MYLNFQKSNHQLLNIRKTFISSLLIVSSVTTGWAQNQRVTIAGNNNTILKAFEEIEKQTGLSIAYNQTKLNVNKKIRQDFNDKNLSSVMTEILKDTGFSYQIEGNHIIIVPGKSPKALPVSNQNSSKKISGVILDSSGLPIIGANVVIEGTTTGVISDLDGKFTLEAPVGSKLQISYIGYLSKEISITGKETHYNIELWEDTQALEEVVVVGYGSQKKVNVIGSIAMVGSEKIENRATGSVVSALTGQMPGVTITQQGGRPGTDTGTIRIRGVGSFGATPNALILIDGIPGNITDINPSDIESISVLKDASSAAIYGARAANGVILVTTKMGKEQKVSVSYNGYVGTNKATELPKFVDTWDFARYYNEAVGFQSFSESDIQAMRDGSQPDRWANDKYVDDVFSGNGIQTGHELSINGGSDRNQYFVSLGYLSQNGIVSENNYTRYTGRVNLSSNLSDKLKLTVRLRGDKSKTTDPAMSGILDRTNGSYNIIQEALRYPGYSPSILSNGDWGAGYKNYGSPKAWLASKSFVEKPVLRINSSVNLDYEPIKGLKLSAIGAYNFTNSQDKNYHATQEANIDGNVNVLGVSRLTEKNTNTEYKSFQATANYAKTFNEKHNLDVLVGYSWEDEKVRDITAQRENFPNNNYPYLSVGSPDTQTNSGAGSDWVIQSVFGRAQYNYAERYLGEITMRYDGSSRFPKDSRYAFFPSMALGWRLSEENFIKENENLSFINNLKLKASIGILGNNNIGNYAYQSVYVLGNKYNYPLGGTIQQGAQLTTYVDPRLKWETTRTVDAGFESILWDGLLNLNVSYFHRYTYDILFKPNASASAIFGLNMSEVNTGEALNHGWEFELGHNNQIGDFKYGINANLSIINNEVKSLGVGNVEQPNGLVGNGSDLFIGYPMQMYYGYVTDGLFVDQADIDSWFAHTDQSVFGKNKEQTKPGDIRYVDISGPDGVPDGKIDATYDRTYLGSRIPKFTYGITLNGTYKGFDLNVFLQGVAGVNGMLAQFSAYSFYSEGNLQKWQVAESFKPESPNRYATFPRLQVMNYNDHITQVSDYWVRNASYLRIKNIQLGYTLPKQCLKNTFISNLRVYVSSENPFTFHHYPEGWDPETFTATDNGYYPILRNVTFGLNLKF